MHSDLRRMYLWIIHPDQLYVVTACDLLFVRVMHNVTNIITMGSQSFIC